MRKWPRAGLVCVLLLMSATALACGLDYDRSGSDVTAESGGDPAHFVLSGTATPQPPTPTRDPSLPTPPPPPVPTPRPPGSFPTPRPTPTVQPHEVLVAERVIEVDRPLDALSEGFETLFEWQSPFAGGFTAIAAAEIDGDAFMYAASGSGVWLIDASDPADLRPVEVVATTSHERIEKLVFDGGYLAMWAETGYSQERLSEIAVYRVEDDRSLIEVITASGKVQAIELADGRAFVIDEEKGLFIFSLEGSGGPALLSTTPGWPPPDYEPRPRLVPAYFSLQDVAVQGDYAYVAGGGDFSVLDISDPASPEMVAQLELPVSYVIVSGDAAYAAADEEKFYAIDVSVPSSPEVTHSVAGPFEGFAGGRLNGMISTEAGLAVLTTFSHHQSAWHLQVFDLGADGILRSERVLASMDYAYALAAHNGKLFIGSYVGITSVEPSGLGPEPVPVSTSWPSGVIGTLTPPSSSGVVKLVGNHMVLAHSHGVHVVDMKTGEEVEEAFLPLWGVRTTLSFDGEIHVLGPDNAGRNLDLSDPLRPVLSGSFVPGPNRYYNECGGVTAGRVCYDREYIDGTDTLSFSINDDYEETFQDRIRFIGGPDRHYALEDSRHAGGTRWLLDGGILYAVSNRNLYVIDVSDPQAPVLRTRLTGLTAEHHGSSYPALIRDGDILYVFDSSLWAVDISDPLNPEPVAYRETDATGIFKDGDRIALTSSGGRVEVVRLAR